MSLTGRLRYFNVISTLAKPSADVMILSPVCKNPVCPTTAFNFVKRSKFNNELSLTFQYVGVDPYVRFIDRDTGNNVLKL